MIIAPVEAEECKYCSEPFPAADVEMFAVLTVRYDVESGEVFSHLDRLNLTSWMDYANLSAKLVYFAAESAFVYFKAVKGWKSKLKWIRSLWHHILAGIKLGKHTGRKLERKIEEKREVEV